MDSSETLGSRIKDALQRTEAATFGMGTHGSRVSPKALPKEKVDQKRTTLVQLSPQEDLEMMTSMSLQAISLTKKH